MGILLVGAGGFIGAIGRYLLGGWVRGLGRGAVFPWWTFAVNILGCFLIGAVLRTIEGSRWEASGRLFLVVGILGGFTTFSAFGQELFVLLREHRLLIALLYSSASVILGVLAVAAGRGLASLLLN